MGKFEEKKITVEYSPSDGDWAATVPTLDGAHMGHGRSPTLALQKALRMAGASATQKLQRLGGHDRTCGAVNGDVCTCGRGMTEPG